MNRWSEDATFLYGPKASCGPPPRRWLRLSDDRAAFLESLSTKRERFHEDANRGRELRDRLNDETRRHIQRRDELNGQVRAIVDRANQHRSKRDQLNVKVREAKAARDELNRAAHEKTEALHALRRDRGAPQAGVPLAKLKAELRHLEFQQQTTVLAPKKEKELIDLIAAKLKEIREREGAVEENAEARKAYDEMKEAKARAEEQHQAVTLLATEAQTEHDSMVKLFHEADGLRKLADAAQADFVKNKIEADRAHRGYIESVSALRDVERVMQALRGHTRPGESQPSADEGARAEAEEIFDKFRKGEKLSTEDLMALQKAGRL